MTAILGKPEAHSDVCRFVVEKILLETGEIRSTGGQEIEGSPLLERVFEVPGVTEVVVSGHTLWVKKTSDTDWKTLGRELGKNVRLAIDNAKGPLIDPRLLAEKKGEPREPGIAELERKIRELLDLRINPAVAAHGGKIALIEVREKTAIVQMSGGCQGCGQAAATLREGVERSIREAFPEIEFVRDVTDHASGTNPYYQPTAH